MEYFKERGVTMAFDLTDEELQATREMNKTAWENEIDKWSKEYLIERYKDLVEIEKEHKKENGRLRDRINKTINKLNEDISDDNCMWVNNQEKIVKTAKTIIDRSNYAKEIQELLEERN